MEFMLGFMLKTESANQSSLNTAQRSLLSIQSVAVCLLIAWATPSCVAHTVNRSGVLPKPWQQKAISFNWLPTQTIPKIDHGFIVVSRRVVVNDTKGDVLYLKSLKDESERRIPLWLGIASAIWINDVAVASAEKIYVVGSLLHSSDKTIVNFMAQTDMDGHTSGLVDTGTYEPELACVGGDGTLWTFGQDWSAERSDISYSLIRNYSSTGRLLGSYLQSDILPPAKLNFSTRLHRMGGATGRIFLQCGTESIGAFISPTHTWAEIDLSDRTSHVWSVSPPSAGHMTGMALLGRHQVYCSFRGWQAVFIRGLFKLNLADAKVASWVPVAGMVEYLSASDKTPPVRFLFGSEDSSLVYVDISDRNLLFSWTKP
jgi:hypothetical protein